MKKPCFGSFSGTSTTENSTRSNHAAPGDLGSRKKRNSYQTLLFLASLAAYTSAYLSRDTFSAMMPNILSHTDISKTELGLISTIFLIFYGSGQFINGILGDRFPAHRLVGIGLMCSGLANFFISHSTNALQMSILWGINGFALSMLWAPLVKVLASNMDYDDRKKALINISVSMPLGTLLAFVTSACFSKYADFRLAFQVDGLVIFAVGLVWFAITHTILPYMQAVPPLADPDAKPQTNANKEGGAFAKAIFASGFAFIILAIMCNGIIRNGVSIWVPTYLTENFHLEEFVSILTATVIPIVNLGGIYMVAAVNRRTNNELLTSGLFFAMAGASMSVLIFLGATSPFVAILLLGVTTASMQGLNSIIMSFVPLGYEYCGRVATATGLLNASAYLASSVGSYGVGIISTTWGWNATILAWIFTALLGTVACFVVTRTWRKFKAAH